MLFAEIEKKMAQRSDWRIERTEELLAQFKKNQQNKPSVANELMLQSLVHRLEKLKTLSGHA